MDQLLERTTFKTSRLLDFCSEKELVAQTGHQKTDWPLVVLKELKDNALDACEEAGVAPRGTVRFSNSGSGTLTGIRVTSTGLGVDLKYYGKAQYTRDWDIPGSGGITGTGGGCCAAAEEATMSRTNSVFILGPLV